MKLRHLACRLTQSEASVVSVPCQRGQHRHRQEGDCPPRPFSPIADGLTQVLRDRQLPWHDLARSLSLHAPGDSVRHANASASFAATSSAPARHGSAPCTTSPSSPRSRSSPKPSATTRRRSRPTPPRRVLTMLVTSAPSSTADRTGSSDSVFVGADRPLCR